MTTSAADLRTMAMGMPTADPIMIDPSLAGVLVHTVLVFAVAVEAVSATSFPSASEAMAGAAASSETVVRVVSVAVSARCIVVLLRNCIPQHYYCMTSMMPEISATTTLKHSQAMQCLCRD